MQTKTAWTPIVGPQYSPSLDGATSADVCVVGAGIAGLTAALLLTRAGKSVVVIEKATIGSGETGVTTAHLTEFLDTRYTELAHKFGAKGAELAAQSTRAAIEQIAALSTRALDGCDFARVAAVLCALNPAQHEVLRKESEALMRAGVHVTWGEALNGMGAVAALRIEQQGQIHPAKYLALLAHEFTNAGGRIYENTELTDLIEEEPCRVVTTRGQVLASDVLVLTHVPIINRLVLQTKVAAYRTYAIAGPVATEAIGNMMYYDMDDPYHFIRRHDFAGRTLAIIGGADHKTGQKTNTEESFSAVEAYARTLFPNFAAETRWSGQILEPVDGLPFIGKNPGQEHVYVATGFSGNGMTFGTTAAMMLCDAVMKVDNPWTDLYDPSRIKIFAQAARFISENVDFARFMAGDIIDTGTAASVDDIPREEGRTLRVKGKMIAAYRDEHGELHAHSAVCTHLGCNVHFNAAEKTWDCPCHGGRFDILGQVLNGPPIRALETVEVEQPAKKQLHT